MGKVWFLGETFIYRNQPSTICRLHVCPINCGPKFVPLMVVVNALVRRYIALYVVTTVARLYFEIFVPKGYFFWLLLATGYHSFQKVTALLSRYNRAVTFWKEC